MPPKSSEPARLEARKVAEAIERDRARKRRAATPLARALHRRGRTQNVAGGIRRAHWEGIVTSTTAMMNMPNVEEDLRLALEETPRLGLGVHLVLTAGRPLSAPGQVPSLVDRDGSSGAWTSSSAAWMASTWMRCGSEWRSQAGRFVSCARCTPTHFDSHHHTSYFTPALFRLMLELAGEYHCAIRFGIPPLGDPDTQGIPANGWQTSSRPRRHCWPSSAPRTRTCSWAPSTTRLPRVPACVDRRFAGRSIGIDVPSRNCGRNLAGRLRVQLAARAASLPTLTDPEVMEAVWGRDVELVSFGELGN